jgi:hypothetical protein
MMMEGELTLEFMRFFGGHRPSEAATALWIVFT